LLSVPLFEPSPLAALAPGGPLPIRNIAGFFLLAPGVGDPSNPNNADCLDSANVCGYVTIFPGELVSGGTTPDPGVTTNVVVNLIQ
jgi:hypothetical protein